MRSITFASQQGAPWSGFNGLGARGGFGALGQSGTQATMLDGTIATAIVDDAGNVVGFYALQSDGTTMSYDTNGSPQGATAASSSGLSSFFTALSASLNSLLGQGAATTTVGAPVAAGLSMGTLLLIGGAVYLLASSGSGRR